MKKLLSILLASATAVTACAGLAACEEETNSKELVIWAPTASLQCYLDLGKEFTTTYEDGKYSDYTVKVLAHQEGNALTDASRDITKAGDVFFAAADNVTKIIERGFAQVLPDEIAEEVEDINNPTSILKTNGKMYAFPATGDNTFFFWYDSSVFTTMPTTLDEVVAKAEQVGKQIYFPYSNSWYVSSWFMTAGCTMAYTVNNDGERVFQCDVNGANGLLAAQSLHNYMSPEGQHPNVFVTGDDATFTEGAGNGTFIAGYDGTWVEDDLPASMVPAIAAPTITIGGQQKTYKNAFDYKYACVNTASKNRDVAMELARFITSEHGQQKRYEATLAFPTNKVLTQDDDFLSMDTTKAIMDRAANGVGLDVTDDFWGAFDAFGGNIGAEENPTPYAGLQAAIDLLQRGILGETDD